MLTNSPAVIGAEVIAVEVHPKRPGMYRVSVLLMQQPDLPEQPEQPEQLEQPDQPDQPEQDAAIADRVEAAVHVHEDTLVSWRLLKGRHLTGDEWLLLKIEEEREEAYRSALAILERKARTAKELSLALKRKGYSKTIIDACLERLRSRNILDDAAFAKRFAEQRAVNQRKGRRLIKQELIQRGIGKSEAEEALGQLSDEQERKLALALASKKWPQTKGEYRDRRNKLTGFLLRRGYPSGIVRYAVETVAIRTNGEEHNAMTEAFFSDNDPDDWDDSRV